MMKPVVDTSVCLEYRRDPLLAVSTILNINLYVSRGLNEICLNKIRLGLIIY